MKAIDLTDKTSASFQKVEAYTHKKIDMAYEHEGAHVFVSRSSEERTYGREQNASIYIVKGDNMLAFSMSESVGNDQGTVFTRATLAGAKESKNLLDKEGDFYPHDTTTKDYQEEGDDLLTRAAAIYGRNEKIGEIFNKYVPEKGFKALENQLKPKDNTLEKEMVIRQAFESKLGNF